MNQQLIKRPFSIVLPGPEGLYQFHTVDTAEMGSELLNASLTTTGENPELSSSRPLRDAKSIKPQNGVSVPELILSAHGASDSLIFNPCKLQTDSLFISLLLQGTMELEGRTEQEKSVMTAGALALYERNTPFNYNGGDVRQLFLILPYTDARSALGGGLDERVLLLDEQPLAPFIRSQMMLLDLHAAQLSINALTSILEGLYRVSFLMLADIGKGRGSRIEGRKNFIFSAAKRFIELHYGQVNLSPDVIAVELHCSRSGLDRAFMEQHTSVMRVLQEVRLKSARYRLENFAEERIDTIAWLCGFSSSSIFSKLFKQRFGISPKAWRQAFTTRFSSLPAGDNALGPAG